MNKKLKILFGVLFSVGILVAVDFYYTYKRPIQDIKLAIGLVTKKVMHMKGSPYELIITYQVGTNEYKASYSPSKQAFDLVQTNYPFLIAYSNSNPKRNEVVANEIYLKDSVFIPNGKYRVGEITKINEKNGYNFFRGRSITYEVYYTYTFNGMELECVRFLDDNYDLEVGMEFYVRVNRDDPRIGLMNFGMLYNEDNVIEELNEN